MMKKVKNKKNNSKSKFVTMKQENRDRIKITIRKKYQKSKDEVIQLTEEKVEMKVQ